MKISIINLPRKNIHYSVTRVNRCEKIFRNRVDTPSNLLIISSQLRELHHEVSFIDANGFKIDYDSVINQISSESVDCIVFAFNSRIIEHDLRICSLVKDLDSSILTIGFSWYLRDYAEDILKCYKNLDIQIIDNPIFIIRDLIENIDANGNTKLKSVKGIAYRDGNNEIRINNGIVVKKEFDNIPLPAYDLLSSFKPYHIISPMLKPYALVYSGEGCPYNCNYCTVVKTQYHCRSVEKIMEELRLLRKRYKIKYVWFYDEVFTLNRERSMELFKNMTKEKLNIKWFCDTRTDLVDIELLNLMRKAGCIGIAYGIESGSQTILDLMNKGTIVDENRKTLYWTRKAHLPFQMNLILGFIGESHKTLKETKEFIKETLPNMLQINIIEPLPGTDFFNKALSNGWLIQKSKSNIDFQKYFLDSKKYEPFSLNLYEYSRQFHRIHYLNPKWWLQSFISLIREPKLFLPILSCFYQKLLNHESIFENVVA